MADGVIAFPFHLTPQGEVATAPYGSTREVDEAIAVLALTRIGERPMQPSFGTPDPVFTGLSAGDLQVGLDEFGPEGVTITAVTSTPVNDTEAVARIEWSRDTDYNAMEEL